MGLLVRSDRLHRAHPALASAARVIAAESGRDWEVVTAERALEAVLAKYALGRTVPGPKATPLKPMGEVVTRVSSLEHAPHAMRLTPAGVYCCAIDLQFFVGPHTLSPGETPDDQAIYRWYGERAESLGLVWGGRFKNLFDQAHIEVPGWRNWPLAD